MVYVDSLKHRAELWGWPIGGRSCHMFADDEEELHIMAERIGLRREYIHNHPKLKHYDLAPSKHVLAVELGAIEVTNHYVAEWIKAKED